jgi:hypothetical protein
MDTPISSPGPLQYDGIDQIPKESWISQINIDSEVQFISEECNLLNMEIWNDTTITETESEAKNTTEEEDFSISSEDSFDREKWHRSVLKACTYHASRLDFGKYEPLSFEFDNHDTHRLKVELDSEIPIPIQFRTLWYQLQSDIRKFGSTGLLFPIFNHTINSSEHWRNNSILSNRNVPHGIYVRVLSLPIPILKSLFHPEFKGKVTLSTNGSRKQNLLLNTKDIYKKYDNWYWKAMRVARKLEMEPSSPRRAYSKLRGHSRREANNMSDAEWRSHHYFMWDAIQRNKSLQKSPQWLTQGLNHC